MAVGTPVATRSVAASTQVETVRWTGSWPALAAWGAALLLLALGAGALTGEGGGAWSAITGAALVVLGVGGLIWGTAALARGRIVVPRASVAGCLLGVVATATALAADPLHVSIIAVAAASALLVSLGAVCGSHLRSARRDTGRTDASRPGIIGMLIGALLVAGLVTPALGATEAGRLAPDHSSHDLVFDQHQH
jgi:hypothetical protein